jgi:hypothetical protein
VIEVTPDAYAGARNPQVSGRSVALCRRDERPKEGEAEMSIRIGTLEQKKRFKMWPIVAALIAVTGLAVYLTTADRGSSVKSSTSQTAVGRPGFGYAGPDTLANTPSEVNGGVVGGIVPNTAANTPSEIRGGFAESSQPNDQIGRRNVTPRVGAVAVSNANTPSEITGGMTVGGDTDAKFHPLP